jgi:3,4-dihydroxy-9,10-secoandrosta-1,3,5(10)-triene-9,17-dione 4,5-dioxygenase
MAKTGNEAAPSQDGAAIMRQGDGVERSPIFGLGYVVVKSEEKEAWRLLAEKVLGLSSEVDGERLLFRMDDRVARLVVEQPQGGPSDGGLPVIGWECRDEESFDLVVGRVERAGIGVRDTSGERPWAERVVACIDPAGVPCEFFVGGRVDPATPFVSPTGASFVTGVQGMGHVTIASPRCDEGVVFYRKTLGFQLRETCTDPNGGRLRWAFLSPNPREHSLALFAGQTPVRVLHILVEVSTLDMVGRALDRCLDGLAPLRVSLGRHWNDGMVSFYLRTPSGFDIEYGWGGMVVDPAFWTHREQGGSGRVSLWGHRVIRPDGTLGNQIGQA